MHFPPHFFLQAVFLLLPDADGCTTGGRRHPKTLPALGLEAEHVVIHQLLIK
ncbi:MAG: hypothetical protein IKG81_15190 [Bacteroidales bacterium]|nr:hypothetical protein [Bacteroidales bacterium]